MHHGKTQWEKSLWFNHWELTMQLSRWADTLWSAQSRPGRLRPSTAAGSPQPAPRSWSPPPQSLPGQTAGAHRPGEAKKTSTFSLETCVEWHKIKTNWKCVLYDARHIVNVHFQCGVWDSPPPARETVNLTQICYREQQLKYKKMLPLI